MKIAHRNSPFFHVELEDIFSESELVEIVQYIKNIKPYFKCPQISGTATSLTGDFLKKNIGIFINQIDNENNLLTSKINQILKNISKSKWSNFCYKRFFQSLKWGNELVQSYTDGDYYKPHCDGGIFTLVIWIYENEKMIEGGNLYFPEYNYTYQCRNNCGIIFFSKELHGVTPIKSKNDFNRYSITIFTMEDLETEEKKYNKIIKNSNFFYN